MSVLDSILERVIDSKTLETSNIIQLHRKNLWLLGLPDTVRDWF